MSIFINEKILGFEVSVDNVLLMQVMQCEINLRNIKQRNIIREPAFFSESREDFSSIYELE